MDYQQLVERMVEIKSDLNSAYKNGKIDCNQSMIASGLVLECLTLTDKKNQSNIQGNIEGLMIILVKLKLPKDILSTISDFFCLISNQI